MRTPSHGLIAGLCVLTSAAAAPLAYEAFDYAAATPLTALNGGSGWWEAWAQDGEPAVAGSDGLAYTDTLGNVLDVAGKCADTTGTATTRSLRDLDGGLANDVWISFLWQLPASNSKFEGVSFYRGTQQVFTISNPSTTTTSSIFLTSNLTANNGVLRSADGTTLAVPVAGPLEGTALKGDGWSATLNSGWVVRPAARSGSFTIVPET